MIYISQPLASSCVHPESRSAEVNIPVCYAFTMQGVVAPHCAVTGFIHTEANLFKKRAFVKLPSNRNPH